MRERFDLFVSQLVVRECSGGDPNAGKDRIVGIDGIPVLPITLDAESLANLLVQGGAVPENEPMRCPAKLRLEPARHDSAWVKQSQHFCKR